MARPVVLLVLCLISLTPSLSSCAAAARAHDLRLTLEHARRRLLADATAGAAVPLHQFNYSYVANLAIGTPPQPASAFIHVSGEHVWTQCAPCSRCFPQALPRFDPAASTTYRPEPCGTAFCESIPTRNCSREVCVYEALTPAGDTVGTVGTDALAIGTATARLAFGCVVTSDIETMGGPSGFVGLGRTPWSLVAQMNVTAFSYCLASYDGKKNGALFLGASAKLAGCKVSSTPFVKSSPDDDTSGLYMLRLEAIKAGDTVIPTPPNGSIVVVETAVPFSFLVDSAYQLLKKAVTAQVDQAPTATPPRGLPFDLCFPKATAAAPDLVFTFQGGAAMTLPSSNYLVDVGHGTVCLAILSSARLKPAPVDGLSILGSFQQQNIHLLFDLEKETLSFEPAYCSALS